MDAKRMLRDHLLDLLEESKDDLGNELYVIRQKHDDRIKALKMVIAMLPEGAEGEPTAS